MPHYAFRKHFRHPEFPPARLVALHRQDHEISARLRPGFLKRQEAAARVPRPAILYVLAGRQPHGLPAAIRPLPVEVLRAVARRGTDGSGWCVIRSPGDTFQPEKPRVWSETPVQVRPFLGASFDLHPDGERVVMARVTAATTGPTHVTLIFNFFDELRRLAPVTR